MQITDQTFCIASINPPTIWGVYQSMVQAKRHLAEANRSGLQGGPRAYEIMEYGVYQAAYRAFYAHADGDLLPLSEQQRILKERHGLPHEFAAAVYNALGDISLAEAQAAIHHYIEEFYGRGQTDESH